MKSLGYTKLNWVSEQDRRGGKRKVEEDTPPSE